MKKIQRWWKRTVLTCEDVTRLSFDTDVQKELTFSEKLRLNIHRRFCYFCRRYFKQTKFIREAMLNHQRKSISGNLSKDKLSDESKERLKKVLSDSD